MNFTIDEHITMELLIKSEIKTQEDYLKVFIGPPKSDEHLIKYVMEKIATLYIIKEKLYRAERGL